jgi:general stress protein 26
LDNFGLNDKALSLHIMENHVEKLREMVGKSRVGMLGGYGDERIHFRPMSHVDIDDQGDLWFFTSRKSGEALSSKDAPIQLTYVHETDSTFLSIGGTAHIDTNKAKMKELFNPFVSAWFPKGLEDPWISLLVVHPLEVEYWIQDESKVLTHNNMLSANVPKKKISQIHHDNG